MLNVIGIGPGNKGYITEIGKKIIDESEVLIGGKRNLEIFKNFKGEKIILGSNLVQIKDYINQNTDKNISVIASGDPSVYGIGKYLSKNTDKENLKIFPGISSMQYMFARIKMDMNDLYMTSSHGREPDFDYLLSHKKVCMVTDSKIGPREIAQEIIKRDLRKIIFVGENLSYESEKITIGKPKDILKVEKYDMNIVVIVDEK
ncbi:cobalt-precorrin-7 (C(5))-methyltransferase [Peptacetobacter sp.]|uniref:cobalt-precorrin-7 (C(5))-methyltransferase n=1 Tax=Peptacetobacter sp. TaxID=2991975 RepID=UPI002614327A|nr:cobalt-precorrin-7 (C(5))-methyltransferase [Peptacetobacter sp.]